MRHFSVCSHSSNFEENQPLCHKDHFYCRQDRHSRYGGSTLNTGVTDNCGKLKYKQIMFACKSQLSNIHRTQNF